MTPCMTPDLLIHNVRLAGTGSDAPYGASQADALALANGKICWIGAQAEAPQAGAHVDGVGGWLTPGLVDCHTHLVYGGNRAREFELRRLGASYAEIAAAGGGILGTVRATRAASDGELLEQAGRRLQALMREGVTTIEIKSGYGLSLEEELRLLRLARELGRSHGLTVRTTLLAAHALPPEFASCDAWIAHVVDEILPAAAASGLADAVDVFCEGIAFSPAQCERVFRKATELRLPVKGHVEQLSELGGAALVARWQGLSADHLEYLPGGDATLLAAAGTVAVLLPAAFFYLRETRLPPVAELLAAGVKLAVASDCNPGTAPQASLLAAMSQAATLFGLTPEACFHGVTRHAADALGLPAKGRLELGADADLLLWDMESPAELSYGLNLQKPRRRWIGGREIPHAP